MPSLTSELVLSELKRIAESEEPVNKRYFMSLQAYVLAMQLEALTLRCAKRTETK
jgi:hypothetical protein